MGVADIRQMRICFRATRSMYWGLREMAKERGVTLSTLVYWFVDHTYDEVLANDTANVLGTIFSHLSDEERAARMRTVEMTVDLDSPPW